MKRNYGMFKIIFFIALGMLILTWLIPVSEYSGTSLAVKDLSRMDLFSFIGLPVLSFGFFIYPTVFILIVGSFYGILNKTGVYKTFVEKIAKYFKGKEKGFLILVIVVFGILTSMVGLSIELFLFLPLIISICLTLGYDKITTIASTVGASLIGVIGSTFGTYGSGNVAQVLETGVGTQLITKLILLLVGLAGLIYFVLKHAKALRESKDENEDPLMLEDSVANKKKGLLTIIIVFSVMLVVMVLGYIPWNTTFEITAFEDLHAWLMSLKLGEFKFYEEFFGGVAALGNWWLKEIIMVIFAAEILLWIVYKLSFKDVMHYAFEGAKKVLPVAAILVFVHIIVIITAQTPFFFTIINWFVGLTEGFNIVTATIVSALGAFSYVDLPYFVSNPFIIMTMVLNNEAMKEAYTIMAQGIGGVVMLIAPTSILICIILTYLDVSYKKWFKYIWKFALSMFVVVLIVLATIIVK